VSGGGGRGDDGNGPRQRLLWRERWFVAGVVAVFVVVMLGISALPRSTPGWVLVVLLAAASLLVVISVLISRRR
jgi:cytochrome c biogenesis protein CcdA